MLLTLFNNITLNMYLIEVSTYCLNSHFFLSTLWMTFMDICYKLLFVNMLGQSKSSSITPAGGQ